MKKVSKRDVILESIIKEYLNSGMPIGSSELQVRMNLNISPSTIRIYLKRLSEEGELVQLHVSSGRVPTRSALEHYWLSTIDPTSSLYIENLEDVETSAKEHGIYCKIEKKAINKLKEIVDVRDRYLVLVFDEDEIVLKHSENVKRFLSNLIGCDIKELRNICAQVGLYELREKIEQIFLSSYILKEGESEIYSIAKEFEAYELIDAILNSEMTSGLKEGLYFDSFLPQGTMAIKHNAQVEESDAELFCFGKIQSDFGSFLNDLGKKG